MALPLWSAIGCRQILGLDVPQDAAVGPAAEAAAEADGGSGAIACGMPSGTPSCAACVRASCCKESNACATDAIFCAPYETCLATCRGDPGCRSQCTIDHPVPTTSSASVSALSACLAAKCETECDLTCGGFAGYLSEPDASAACSSCLEQNACPHARACGSSAACDAFWRCFLACPTEDCKDVCAAQNEAGAADFKPLFGDFSGACAGPCRFGNYWACAGHVGNPTAQSTTFTWTDWVYDVANQMPITGATISICTNCPCGTASFPLLAQTQTASDGFFTIQVPQALLPNGQPQPFCVQTTATGYMPNFFYPGTPFSEPSSSIRESLGPPVSLGLVLFTASNVLQDAKALGGTFDPTRGVIAAGIFDCLANPANGVYVSIDSNDPQVVLGAPVAVPDAGLTTLSGGFNTVGHAVFFNVQAGSYVLTTRPPGFSQPIDQITVNVAPGTVTQVGVFPSP
jgi:hypothetical protein